jgi:hypothetical protein
MRNNKEWKGIYITHFFGGSDIELGIKAKGQNKSRVILTDWVYILGISGAIISD